MARKIYLKLAGTPDSEYLLISTETDTATDKVLTGLTPLTAYRARIVPTSEAHPDGIEGEFLETDFTTLEAASTGGSSVVLPMADQQYYTSSGPTDAEILPVSFVHPEAAPVTNLTVTGWPIVGQVLTAVFTPQGGSQSFKWYRENGSLNRTLISGQTAATYTTQAADIGQGLTCEVTTKDAGNNIITVQYTDRTVNAEAAENYTIIDAVFTVTAGSVTTSTGQGVKTTSASASFRSTNGFRADAVGWVEYKPVLADNNTGMGGARRWNTNGSSNFPGNGSVMTWATEFINGTTWATRENAGAATNSDQVSISAYELAQGWIRTYFLGAGVVEYRWCKDQNGIYRKIQPSTQTATSTAQSIVFDCVLHSDQNPVPAGQGYKVRFGVADASKIQTNIP